MSIKYTGEISFNNVSKYYGKILALHNFNLKVNSGERIVLLGPSGCGKSTALRLIAGLEEISEGELYFDSQLVNFVEPGDRNVAMVFQNYALYPHMNVYDNIAFGLNIRKLPHDVITAKINDVLKVLELTNLQQRKPRELSGGQRQRVALARAIVKESPYLLLDEPLSNLDAQLRQHARNELVRIHDIYKPTLVYVTHDQIEAMTIADRIAVLNKGELQQIDSPINIYNKPANTFVATFIGSPSMNLLNGIIDGNKLLIGNSIIDVPLNYLPFLRSHKNVILGIRPENCTLSINPLIESKLLYVENLGSHYILKMQTFSGELLSVASANLKDDLSLMKGINFCWDNAVFFHSVTKENIINQ